MKMAFTQFVRQHVYCDPRELIIIKALGEKIAGDYFYGRVDEVIGLDNVAAIRLCVVRIMMDEGLKLNKRNFCKACRENLFPDNRFYTGIQCQLRAREFLYSGDFSSCASMLVIGEITK